MKGIVVETSGKSAVILSDDGLFIKVNNKKYAIGQTIIIKKNKSFGSKWIAGAASMAAVMALGTVGAFAYYTPTDYVSMDVNPSIEYSVNMFDRILDTKAVNDDGAKILADLDLDHMNLEDAMKETLDKLVTDGYLTDDPDSGVVITTSNKDDDMEDAEKLAAELEKEISSYLKEKDSISADVDAEAVGQARVQEARELGVTPGKLNLVEKLEASTGSAIDREEWLKMPVKEINKAIKENRKLEKEKAKESFNNGQSKGDATTESAIGTEKESGKPVKADQKNPGNNKYKDNIKNNSGDDQDESEISPDTDQDSDQTIEPEDEVQNGNQNKNEDQGGNGKQNNNSSNKPDNSNKPED